MNVRKRINLKYFYKEKNYVKIDRKKLISEFQTNEELRAKTEGINDPAELAKKAVEAGYDVTLDELVEAEKELRKERADKTDAELSLDDLEAAAGGASYQHDVGPDGRELGCSACDYTREMQEYFKVWCKQEYWCQTGNWIRKENPNCPNGYI